MAQSDVMCSFTRPKGTSQGEAVITHEVRITFRRGGTHRSKNVGRKALRELLKDRPGYLLHGVEIAVGVPLVIVGKKVLRVTQYSAEAE